MEKTVLRSAAVYRNGCIVKRSGKVYLKQGAQQVCFEGITASADDNSLRLSVPEGIFGSNVQVEHPTKEKQQEALKELTAKLDRVKKRIENQEKLAALWEANADFSQKESLSIEEMAAYLEKLPGRLEELGEEIDALTEERKALEEELKEARKQAALPYVVAELEAQAEGEYPIELTYRDYQASWNPVYEIHAEDGTDSLKLRMRAQIFQNTGEDWEGVRLTLFTGNPSISGTIPTLYPSHIRFYEPRVYESGMLAGGVKMKMARANAEMVEEDAIAYDEAPMEAMMAMNTVMAGSAAAVKNETMTEYQLTGTWDIRDGQDILCDIRTDEVSCRYHAVAVPKLSEEVYLAAEVKTADLEDMQETPASVYLKGAFAGNVVLQPDMTKETYDLSLGVDETMKVKRTQKKRQTSQVLLKGQKKTEYEYEINVTSRKEKTVSVTVTDQIPVSDEKTIIVDLLDRSEGVLKEDTGLIRWDFELAPAAAKVLKLAYTVAWPKDKKTEER